MEETKKEMAPKQPKKLSYEELQNVAGQLQQQNLQLRRALAESNYTNAFKRLDYLFKVLQYEDMFDDRDFVLTCVEEIQTAKPFFILFLTQLIER